MSSISTDILTFRILAIRIKKIMQSDEDVGKIGGSTPALVSKAVELFLQEMCQALENEARQKGTKKVTMYHMYV